MPCRRDSDIHIFYVNIYLYSDKLSSPLTCPEKVSE